MTDVIEGGKGGDKETRGDRGQRKRKKGESFAACRVRDHWEVTLNTQQL